jgi:ABC-type antimicrobial peptide transport system permease subunit
MGATAASAAFLSYVLGELAALRAVRAQQIAFVPEEGAMAQLLWILGVALLVCAISNVTSMLLSVSRRFREIGTMKCLGAFDRSVLLLFLVEALLLGGAGALAGAVAGGVLSLLLAVARFGFAVVSGKLLLTLAGGAIGTFLAVLALSLLGALYPAYQASRMLPIEAMRATN